MSNFTPMEDEDAQSVSQQEDAESSTSGTQSQAFPDEDEDTITMVDVIESEDKVEEEENWKNLIEALGQMDRVAAIEAIHGYNSLKTDLSNYLRKFADCKKVVREQDIHEFFNQMRAKKHQKRE